MSDKVAAAAAKLQATLTASHLQEMLKKAGLEDHVVSEVNIRVPGQLESVVRCRFDHITGQTICQPI